MNTSISFKAILLSLATIASTSDAFLGIPPPRSPAGNPHLLEYAMAQTGILLNVVLNIPENMHSNDATSSRLIIDGLKIELTSDAVFAGDTPLKLKLDSSSRTTSTSRTTISEAAAAAAAAASTISGLPTSSGPLGLKIHSDGQFISMKGQQKVSFERSCREMNWLEESLLGDVVVGFYLATDAVRNDAVLPSGHVYLKFPIFTKHSLGIFQSKQKVYNDALNDYYRVQFDSLEEMKKTKSLLKKLVYFKDSYEKFNEIMKLKSEFELKVPTTQNAGGVLLSIGEDLFLGTKGSVWSKTSGKDADSVLVGEASLK